MTPSKEEIHAEANNSIFDKMIAASLLEEVKEMRKDIATQTKAFNDFRVEIAPLAAISVDKLQSLTLLNADELRDSISTTKTLTRINWVMLPVVLLMLIQASIFGLNHYIDGRQENNDRKVEALQHE